MEEPLKRPSFSDLRPAPITTRRIETPVFSIKCDAQTGPSSNGGGGGGCACDCCGSGGSGGSAASQSSAVEEIPL